MRELPIGSLPGGASLVKERPRKVVGVTYRVETPVGTAFVTINANGEISLWRFLLMWARLVRIALMEALVANFLNLRIASSFSPRVLAQVIDQRGNWRRNKALVLATKVRSLADGIAYVKRIFG